MYNVALFNSFCAESHSTYSSPHEDSEEDIPSQPGIKYTDTHKHTCLQRELETHVLTERARDTHLQRELETHILTERARDTHLQRELETHTLTERARDTHTYRES